jgi:hypothetical protein
VILGLLFLPGAWPFGVFMFGVAAVFEVFRRASLGSLSTPTRGLVLDDARARRFRPWRWDWAWPTRLRPWWWLLLMQIPPPVALLIVTALLAAAIAGGVWFWVVVLGIAEPFVVRRVWRWWRLAHPGRRSWRPPVT